MGPGLVAVIVIGLEDVLFVPSDTRNCALNVPAAKEWLGLAAVDEEPSPKVQL